MNPQAFVFDAYGTLFAVHSVAPDLPALSQLWRQKQLEYTWLRSLMNRYEDFWSVTEAALRAAAAQLTIELSDAEIDRLMQAYLVPRLFPDAAIALHNLRGRPLAILSNGSPKMLDAAVRGNGLHGAFAHVLSVDHVKTYKPSPRVYALGPEMLGIPASEILFVSSNAWDAAGAKAFGYRVCWCNRIGASGEWPEFRPDVTVSSLDKIKIA
jgi:2-haloacid dehalogenase